MTLHPINVWTEHVSLKIYTSGVTITPRENCPNTKFFLVGIQENTDQKKLSISTLLMQYKLVDLQIVSNSQKLLQVVPLRWRKPSSNEASLAPRYLNSSTTSRSSRAFDGAPSLWQFMCMIFVWPLLILSTVL